jgi:hypothetical protein
MLCAVFYRKTMTERNVYFAVQQKMSPDDHEQGSAADP